MPLVIGRQIDQDPPETVNDKREAKPRVVKTDTPWVAVDVSEGSRPAQGSALPVERRESSKRKEVHLGQLGTRRLSQVGFIPSFLEYDVVLNVAAFRMRRFGIFTAAVSIGSLTWAIIKFFMMVNGENSVSLAAFQNLGQSITNTIAMDLTRDLVYQDMVANFWMVRSDINHSEFRTLIVSDVYAPGLKTISAMSLIRRVMGSERAAFEADAGARLRGNEVLRQQCCANTQAAGLKCSTIAGSGLFCTGANPRYQITQNGPNGTLVPAVGNSSQYLKDVGAEEYMVVDMIEPFSTNSRVWGFNLLSNPIRLEAWKLAKKQGQKTFTRRLNLVQSTSSQFGVLVWLPIFQRPDGSLVTAFSGVDSSLTPWGSVNGVYFLQDLMQRAIDGTYTEDQLQNVRIFLYDNDPSLNGTAQFLAAYGTGDFDPYTKYGSQSIDSALSSMALVYKFDVTIPTTNMKWLVGVGADSEYLAKRRTNTPTLILIFSCLMILAAILDRILGHPRLMLRSIKKDERPEQTPVVPMGNELT